jgi:hypothetical protein
MKVHMEAILFVVALTGIGGCDPDFRLAGSVVDTSGSPVAGAIVRIDCSSMHAEVTTDSAGRFNYFQIGVSAADCPIEVRSASYATWTAQVGQHCTQYYRSGLCQHVEPTTIVLKPLPGTPSTTPSASSAASSSAPTP